MIAIPSNRDWKAAFGYSLAGLAVHLTKKNVDFNILSLRQVSNICAGRQAIAEQAREKFSHLLFLDDDMKFTPETFDIIASREKDVVGANYLKKAPKQMPITKGFDKEPILSKGKSGIEKTYQIGMGFTLINTKVFSQIPLPYFRTETEVKGSVCSYLGEDFYFCRLLKENNIDVYVDHDASKHVAHIGEMAFQESF